MLWTVFFVLMNRGPPGPTLTDTLLPSTTLFRSRDTARAAPPLARRDDPRHDVERDQPLVAALGAIDVEGDADGAKESLRLLRLAVDARGVLAVEPVAKFAVGRSDLAPLALHLVEEANERSEEHTSELQSLMRISYAVFCLKKKKNQYNHYTQSHKITH